MATSGTRGRTRRFGRILIVSCAIGVFAAVLAAHLCGIRVYVITGTSMAPTINQGSVIVTRTVAATELHVGDIVTVQRSPEGRTVTHRIVEVSASTESNRDASVSTRADPTTRLILQGDANPVRDSSAYHLSTAQLYLFSFF